jgi:hypothetical protein
MNKTITVYTDDNVFEAIDFKASANFVIIKEKKEGETIDYKTLIPMSRIKFVILPDNQQQQKPNLSIIR